MASRPEEERMVVAHTAGTSSEAIVIRGLLESAGIHSPNFDAAEPFPFNEPSDAARTTEIFVRESQADEAKRVIKEYVQGNSSNTAEGD